MSDLSQTLLSEELRGLTRTHRTGVLEVITPDWAKGVFLIGGRIVFASSTLEKDKLGEHLIRLGRISRDDFVLAFHRSQADRERLGRVLVDAGLIDHDELGRVVAQQVQRIILSLFALTLGEARFHEGTDPIPRDLAVDVSTERLLFEGARVFPDVSRLEAALGDLSRGLRLASPPPFDLARVSLTPPEKAILDCAKEEATVTALLAHGPSRPLLIRAVYALVCGGVLVETAAPRPIAASKVATAPVETGTFQMGVPAAPPHAARPSAVTPPLGLREQILRLYEALPRATHYEILELPPDASARTIDTAYRRITAEQDREWRELMGDVQLSTILGTLRLRRREAYLLLSEPGRRAAYDKRLGQAAPSGDASRTVTAERHTRARQLTEQAQGLHKRGEPERAVPLLLEAVDLDPEERPARRLLALTLAQHPTLQRNAERHFLVALEKDPGDVDLRFRLATYYTRLGLPARARVHLEAVLKADAEHEGAQRELARLDSDGPPRSR
jgi:tetratricopeptide (TPR) repeat protein